MTLLELIEQNKEDFGEGAIDAVKAALKAAKEQGYSVITNNDKEPEFIPKTRLDEVISVRNQLREQVDNLTTDLAKLKKSAEGNEELKSQIEAMQAEVEKAKTKNKEVTAKAAAKMAAVQAKAKDPDDVLLFVDFGKIVIDDDGTVTGLDEQMTTLLEKKAYLFGEEGGSKGGSGGGNPPGGGGNFPPKDNPWKSETFNLTKQGQVLKTDPALAQKLMQEAGKII